MGTTARFRLLTIPAVAAGILCLGPGPVSADEGGIPFEVADVYAELNDTDGDLGFHALIDGEEWRALEIEAPDGRELLEVHVKGRLRRQGLTELFLESAEPSFDELSPEDFFRRFPEGEYEVEGLTLGREELESADVFSHVMPAPVDDIRLSGEPAASNCDADPLPAVSEPVTIAFAPVLLSHPDIGSDGPVTIAKYEVVVEREEPELLGLAVDLPPTVTAFTVPGDFTALGEEFKFEILAVAEDGNRTAVESCFEIE